MGRKGKPSCECYEEGYRELTHVRTVGWHRTNNSMLVHFLANACLCHPIGLLADGRAICSAFSFLYVSSCWYKPTHESCELLPLLFNILVTTNNKGLLAEGEMKPTGATCLCKRTGNTGNTAHVMMISSISTVYLVICAPKQLPHLHWEKHVHARHEHGYGAHHRWQPWPRHHM